MDNVPKIVWSQTAKIKLESFQWTTNSNESSVVTVLCGIFFVHVIIVQGLNRPIWSENFIYFNSLRNVLKTDHRLDVLLWKDMISVIMLEIKCVASLGTNQGLL